MTTRRSLEPIAIASRERPDVVQRAMLGQEGGISRSPDPGAIRQFTCIKERTDACPLEKSMLEPIHKPRPTRVTRLGNPFRSHLYQVATLDGERIEVCADNADQAASLARLWGYTTLGTAIKIN